MRFYLGTHQPSWLARDLRVPLLVSHRRLAGRRSLPRATGPWALDSGGFTELSLHGRWRTDPAAYVAAVRRYATEIGHLEWAAPQDWMTEDHLLARTGESLRTHQHRTVANYLQLRDLASDLPIIPVLQGQSITDYHRCADLYERHGIDLAALPLVGVGSVCRRQHTTEVERIVRSLAARGYHLHTFGAKVLGLARYADTVTSSDSMAWSFRGRHVSGCTPSHRSESNCLRFALAWHDDLTRRLRTTRPARPVKPHRTSTRPLSTGPDTHARSNTRPPRDPVRHRSSRRRAETR
ncbi:deazapurine DNA modification protein DpdA family protein [Saccharothrix sp. NRRL B-16314]|uniref:deazapurine DNA modification protein DpdA family protein n=1 Tax=Saccharothrix sp. NRRL B-16314 TaxID=1463825 RepID=UPI000A65CFC7|nr:hypothetical protein [Saccharothrix sp. NRRL B-16314]